MFTIQTNKHPIARLEISEDLQTFKIFFVPGTTYDDHEPVLSLLKPLPETGGFQVRDQEAVEIHDSMNIDTELEKLTIDLPRYLTGYKPPFIAACKARGIANTLECHIEQLYARNYLTGPQGGAAINFIKKQSLLITQQKKAEREKNVEFILDVENILQRFNNLHFKLWEEQKKRNTIDLDPIFDTFRCLETLKFGDYDLKYCKAKEILNLFLNEDAIDEVLKFVKSDEVSFSNELVEFQKAVKNFCVKYNSQLMEAFENGLPNTADWFQQIYKMYKPDLVQKNSQGHETVDLRLFGPLTKVRDMMTNTFFGTVSPSPRATRNQKSDDAQEQKTPSP
jgi:hypothetical protein